jgi:ubiquinone/menaquinone biosynthesis C-methylase UbiE
MAISSLLPDLRERVHIDEIMDDLSIMDARLHGALRDLRLTNQFLGGYAATRRVLRPLLQRRSRLHVLDVGTGGGDSLVDLVRFGHTQACRLEATGIDLNPGAVDYAERYLDDTLSPRMRRRARVEVGDAMALDLPDDHVDVAVSSLFLHHFRPDDAAAILREMDRVARFGILVNDLHRHPLAYLGVLALSRLLPASAMYRHDAPLSVRRGFRREELRVIARRAGLRDVEIRWHWAFRWTVSSVSR